MMKTDPLTASGADVKSPSMGSAIASEWTKLRSLRSNRVAALLALVLAFLSSGMFLLSLETTTGEALETYSTYDVVTSALLGADVAALVLTVVAAWSIGSEFTNGMIRTTMTATPRHSRFLVAKTVNVLVATYVIGVVAAGVCFLTAQLLLAAEGLPLASFSDPDNYRLILGAALMAPFYSLWAVAFAIIFRGTAGGVIAALIALLAPPLVGILPDWWQDNVLLFLPGEALHSISGVTDSANVYLSPVLAVVAIVLWLLAVMGLAYGVMAKRDV